MTTGPIRVVVLQPPAWPRETPGASLARTLAVPRIALGDLVRDHLRRDTELGTRAARAVDSGGPFPDGLAHAIVRDRLRRTTPAAFLLDRYPLNTVQAVALDALLHELGTPLHGVLHLRLPAQESEHRAQQGDTQEDRLRRDGTRVAPVVRHYAGQGLLVTVDSAGPPDGAAARALTALRQHLAERSDAPAPLSVRFGPHGR